MTAALLILLVITAATALVLALAVTVLAAALRSQTRRSRPGHHVDVDAHKGDPISRLGQLVAPLPDPFGVPECTCGNRCTFLNNLPDGCAADCAFCAPISEERS